MFISYLPFARNGNTHLWYYLRIIFLEPFPLHRYFRSHTHTYSLLILHDLFLITCRVWEKNKKKGLKRSTDVYFKKWLHWTVIRWPKGSTAMFAVRLMQRTNVIWTICWTNPVKEPKTEASNTQWAELKLVMERRPKTRFSGTYFTTSTRILDFGYPFIVAK